MSVQRYDAVFENGVFRPLTAPPAELTEGQQVRLIVETARAEDMLELAARVYQGLSDEQIDEVERIALDRRDFFDRTNR
jgi:predicted DNA-binding antitoxin AbrB/MazE fold protein